GHVRLSGARTTSIGLFPPVTMIQPIPACPSAESGPDNPRRPIHVIAGDRDANFDSRRGHWVRGDRGDHFHHVSAVSDLTVLALDTACDQLLWRVAVGDRTNRDGNAGKLPHHIAEVPYGMSSVSGTNHRGCQPPPGCPLRRIDRVSSA